jgi:hypothetical protein
VLSAYAACAAASPATAEPIADPQPAGRNEFHRRQILGALINQNAQAKQPGPALRDRSSRPMMLRTISDPVACDNPQCCSVGNIVRSALVLTPFLLRSRQS